MHVTSKPETDERIAGCRIHADRATVVLSKVLQATPRGQPHEGLCGVNSNRPCDYRISGARANAHEALAAGFDHAESGRRATQHSVFRHVPFDEPFGEDASARAANLSLF